MKEANYKNEVILFGRVGKEPEEKNGYVQFSMCTTRYYRKKELPGSQFQKENSEPYGIETFWHKIRVFGEYMMQNAKMLKQGSKIEIKGELASWEYTDDNNIKQKYWFIRITPREGRIYLIEEAKNTSKNLDHKKIDQDWESFTTQEDNWTF